MKAISLWQPWASAIVEGLKHYETRSWRPTWEGIPIAIHAALRRDPQAMQFLEHQRDHGYLLNDPLPFGAVVAVAVLTRCVPTNAIRDRLTLFEREWGDYSPGRWAWKLEDVRPLRFPLPWKGRQGWFDVEIPTEHLTDR